MKQNSKNMQLLDVLVYNLGILAELQVKMSRSCQFLLFLPHNYQVILIIVHRSSEFFK